MARTRKGRAVHGVILLDKPAGESSNHALQRVKRLFNAQKAGHTGNLDPFATGMLPICLGEATKTAGFMLDSNKTYEAVARLGLSTDTGDPEGSVVSEMPVPELNAATLTRVFSSFSGEISQVPPMYSALKHQGQPLYKLAREGREVERKARVVFIHELELLELHGQHLSFRVRCSKGTYVRTLAEDLAASLGTCAHLVTLRRHSVEPFSADEMVSFEELESVGETAGLDEHLLPVDAGLADWRVTGVDADQAVRFAHGNPVAASAAEAGHHRVYGPTGQLLGLGIIDETGMLKPVRVFRA